MRSYNRDENVGYNIRIWAKINDTYNIRNIDKIDKLTAARELGSTFICVECGDWLPGSTVKFYNADPQRMTCFNCNVKKRRPTK